MRRLRRDVIGILQLLTILRRIFALSRTPVFWIFTFFGNACIVGGALLLQRFESAVNPVANDFLECLIWAVGLVTTVGAGNISPVTVEGKILMVLMMIGGALFLWSYMALFIGALVDPELRKIERDVSFLQQEAKEDDQILAQLKHLVGDLEVKLAERRKRQGTEPTPDRGRKS